MCGPCGFKSQRPAHREATLAVAVHSPAGNLSPWQPLPELRAAHLPVSFLTPSHSRHRRYDVFALSPLGCRRLVLLWRREAGGGRRRRAAVMTATVAAMAGGSF